MATRLGTTGSNGYNNVRNGNYSSNNSNSVKRIPMFRVQGLQAEFPNTKTSIKGVILPAFDPSLDEEDQYRPMSVGSYRDTTQAPDSDGNFPLSAWSVTFEAYTFYGNSMQHFISPRAANLPDPLCDLRNHLWQRHNDGDDSLQHLTIMPQNADWRTFKLAIPKPQSLTLLNIWGTGSNPKATDAGVEKNRILALKTAPWEKLVAELNTERPASVKTARDPEYDGYLLGDITNPERAVSFVTAAHEFTTSKNTKFTAVCMEFGSLVPNPAGGKMYRCKETRIPAEALTGRYDLDNTDAFLHIPTYEEITQMLIDDGLIPHDLIREVCVPNCSKPVTFPDEATAESSNPAAAPVTVTPAAVPADTKPQPVLPQAPVVPQTSSLLADDPTDDIPYEDTPATVKMGDLSPEEEAELKQLQAMLTTDVASFTPDKLTRLNELISRSVKAN